MDQYIEPGQDGDQEDQIIPTEVQAADCSRQTDRAVYRIDPRAAEKELRLEPRPDDRTNRTEAHLPDQLAKQRLTVKPELTLIKWKQRQTIVSPFWSV
ncbi:hypothetical protein F2Q68_00008968 [Brassica cretica]|uniref:Uncharacterized protein n=1 Tax=Brassica cretica TaxID=69181 RepID=A0A8S9KTH3_BRACR|nr:hypothetical protein F2Q68_00008968 [Brassica cretica]